MLRKLLLSILLVGVVLCGIVTVQKYQDSQVTGLKEEVVHLKPIIKMKVDMIEIESYKYPYFYVKGSGHTFTTLQLTFNVGDSLYIDENKGIAYNPKTKIESKLYE